MSLPSGKADEILDRFERMSGRPLRAMIEISDRCNEVCVHCYQEQGQKGEMSTEQLKALLDELAELGVLVLTISGGEATLRKDFLEVVAHARARGFALRIFTNGLTMTRALAHRLGQLAVHIVEISLYSHRPEVHEFVTGVPGSFVKTVSAVRDLVAEGVDVHLKSPALNLNQDELDAYVAFATGLGAACSFDPNVLMPRENGERTSEVFSRTQTAYANMLRNPLLSDALPERSYKPLDATLCSAGEGIHIEPNGELRPCTMLDVSLGHALAAGGVGHALVTNATQRDMLALRWRDVHGCRECDLRAYCARCHAAALAEAGDALAPYASACANARTAFELARGITIALSAEPGRDPLVGPYRDLGDGCFEAFRDTITPADDALAARLGWTRREGGVCAAPARVQPGALVQIRRPGRGKPKWERVPGSEAALPAEQQHEVPFVRAEARAAATS